VLSFFLFMSSATSARDAIATTTQIDLFGNVFGSPSLTLTPADAPISIGSPFGGADIDVIGNGIFWTFNFRPLQGESLTAGKYPSAQRSPFQSPKRPGLSIFGYAGCNTLTGEFTVYEIAYDPIGNITKFAADATQYCDGNPNPLYARVRINSDIPMVVAVPQAIPGLPQEVYEHTLVTLDGSQSYEPGGEIVGWHWTQVSGAPVTIESPSTPVMRFRAPEVPPGGADIGMQLEVVDSLGNHATDVVFVHVFDQKDRRSWLTWRSPVGDFVGGGKPLTFSADDGDILLSGHNSSWIEIYIDGGAFNSWTLMFQAADHSALSTGTYLAAERWPFQDAGHPALSIYGDGRGCNNLSGQFNVFELDPSDPPTQFAARFVQSCEGFEPPLRGTLLYNAIAPGNPIARIAGPWRSLPDQPVTLDGSGSSSTGSALVSYSWRQISGPTVTTSDATQPTLQFTMPTTTVPLVFELEVDDEDGLVSVAQASVSAAAVLPTPSPVPVDGRPFCAMLSLLITFVASQHRYGSRRSRQ